MHFVICSNLSRIYSLLVSSSQRWGLCCPESSSVLLQRVPGDTDSPRREDRRADRRHPVTHLGVQAHWEVIRSAHLIRTSHIQLFLLQFFRHSFLFLYACRFHQNRKLWWHRLLKRKRRWRQQVRRIFTCDYCQITETWLQFVMISVFCWQVFCHTITWYF